MLDELAADEMEDLSENMKRVSKTGLAPGVSSPEILNYNISSPPMSATPMHRRPHRPALMPDDTVEIERDMKCLLDSVDDPSNALDNIKLSYPKEGVLLDHLIARGHMQRKAVCDSEELETQAFEETQEDSDIDMDMSADVPMRAEKEHIEDQTIGLEDNMAILLAQTQSPTGGADRSQGSASSKRKIELEANGEDDHTVELEVNMTELLATVDCESNIPFSSESSKKKPRKSFVSSHRFSLLPKKSSQMDVNEGDDEDFKPAEVDNGETEEQQTKDLALLSLVPEEILRYVKIKKIENLPRDMISLINFHLGESKNSRAIAGMTVFLDEVCSHLEKGSMSAISPDFFSHLSEESRDNALTLQRFVRSDDHQEVTELIGRITSAIGRSERIEWVRWLLKGSEQLLDHVRSVVESMAIEHQNVKTNMGFIERSERILYDCERKKVRQARRKSLERRKVRCSESGF